MTHRKPGVFLAAPEVLPGRVRPCPSPDLDLCVLSPASCYLLSKQVLEFQTNNKVKSILQGIPVSPPPDSPLPDCCTGFIIHL